jgi:hypothetical protein
MSQLPQKPTIEDLLRLKRAERPTEDFWTRFDAELRAKQLAALVQKPTWSDVLRVRLARFALPIGMAAACIMSGVVWLQTRPVPSVVAVVPAPAAQLAAIVTDTPVSSISVAQIAVMLEPDGPALASSVPAPSVVVHEAAQVASQTTSEATPSSTSDAIVPPITFTAGTVVELPPVNESTFAAVVMPIAAPTFPADFTLSATTPLLAAYTALVADPFAVPSPSFAQPLNDVRVGERVSRNLDNERLYAAGRRVVALDEGRVSVKFW